jgi:transaldolase
MNQEVPSQMVEGLTTHFADFRRANTEDGLSIAEFDSFGPTRRTSRQFIAACGDLNAIVRDVMLPNPDTA